MESTLNNWDNVANDIEFSLEIAVHSFENLIPKSASILDFGCGYGRITNQLYSLGYQNIVGVDSSSEMINRGAIEFPHLNLIQLKDDYLPFDQNSFDAVVACAVFTCISEKHQRVYWINELSRVLKSNALIHLAEFCSEEGALCHSSFGIPMWHGSQQDLESMLDQFKIEITHMFENNTLTGKPSKACHIFGRKIV